MDSKPVLHYFAYFGRAEPIRMAMTALGIEFEENVIKHEHSHGEEGKAEWEEKKKNYEFAALPVLEIDGKMLS